MLAEAGADPSLRDALAAALEANRQLVELTGKLREENARLREDNARLLARVAERDAELDRVRADLAVLQRMLFGRSSERSRPGPAGGANTATALVLWWGCIPSSAVVATLGLVLAAASPA